MFTYNGTTQGPTASVSNLAACDLEQVSITVTGQQIDAGTYSGTSAAKASALTGDRSSNYTLTNATGTTKDFTINQLVATLLWGTNSFTYNGTAQGPTASVSNLASGDLEKVFVSVTGQQITAGTYSDNNAAKASTLTGDRSSNYTLVDAVSKSKDFTISPKNATDQTIPDIYDVNIGSIPYQKYTGKEITPSLDGLVEFNDMLLFQGTSSDNKDFTVTYSDNVSLGTDTAKATLTFHGNYTGERLVHFSIVPRDKDISDNVSLVTISPQTYNGLEIEPEVVMYDQDRALEDGGFYQLELNSDYTLAYENNVNAGTNSARVIITSVEGSLYTGSRETSFTIEPKDFTDDIAIDDLSAEAYTGSEIKPKPTVTDIELDSVLLVEGKDYTLSYENNINPGTDARVIVTGMGNYKNESKDASFTINPKPLEGTTVSAFNSQSGVAAENKPGSESNNSVSNNSNNLGDSNYTENDSQNNWSIWPYVVAASITVSAVVFARKRIHNKIFKSKNTEDTQA